MQIKPIKIRFWIFKLARDSFYGIFAAVLFLNTYAYTKVDMKYGAVIDTFTYVFVMVLSYFILKEKFTKEKLIGNLIIMSGVFIYTLPF